MQQLKTLLVALVVVAVVLAYFSLFTVDQTEKALKFRLGEVVESGFEPGLHRKMPFVNNVRKFDARVQTLDETPARFLTQEMKNVIVDSFVKWRIEDERRFYTSVRGDVDIANQRLANIVRQGLREEFGKRTMQDVISGERVAIMEVLTEQAAVAAQNLGIEIVDVRIRRLDLPADVSDSVFDRMRAERERVARDFRARGHEAAERIRAEADREREVILANAYRDAEQTRGEGDARAAEIYAQAFTQDEEFYSFYRSLGAYTRAFSDESDILLLSPDSQFFRYFNRHMND
ncbi:HflC protein [Alkalilimnicola ehrlichii]|uniref:Protein HflC n=1 Tax=Alkalilimnicola ehrlichii TaxID=351052 RepID=A0A3E0WYY6_9GAMM|nr:protease modulator HflC [Alkalilimnicola ehrlichii]RFA30466.1 HflC protein [Alkalilimnicola ehrlichii]RFA38018.1 HflC protein [Alkalilimnicola ehrlichii]